MVRKRLRPGGKNSEVLAISFQNDNLWGTLRSMGKVIYGTKKSKFYQAVCLQSRISRFSSESRKMAELTTEN